MGSSAFKRDSYIVFRAEPSVPNSIPPVSCCIGKTVRDTGTRATGTVSRLTNPRDGSPDGSFMTIASRYHVGSDSQKQYSRLEADHLLASPPSSLRRAAPCATYGVAGSDRRLPVYASSQGLHPGWLARLALRPSTYPRGIDDRNRASGPTPGYPLSAFPCPVPKYVLGMSSLEA